MAGGWVDKKCGSELGEWRKGRRGKEEGRGRRWQWDSSEFRVIDHWWATMFPLRL